MQYLVALICLFVWLGVITHLTTDRLAWGAEESDKQKATEKTTASVEERRLAFDMKKYKSDYALEQIKAYGTIGSIAVPLLVAALAYWSQVRSRKRDEAHQFQLKAAEIIMDSRDTDQARSKAELLTRLFPERLEALKEIANKKSIEPLPYFGPTMERREELLRLLAQYPESRGDIIRAWEILFPWSVKGSNPWFEDLKRDTALNQNKTTPVPSPPPGS